MVDETGGKIIDITNAESVSRQLAEVLHTKVEGITQISSDQVGELNSTRIILPEDSDYVSYPFVFPLPCDSARLGNAELIYLPYDELE